MKTTLANLSLNQRLVGLVLLATGSALLIAFTVFLLANDESKNGLTYSIAAIGAITAATAVTFGLRRFVIQPVEDLRDTTQKIVDSQDYSLRAAPVGKDQFGHLITAYNSMLVQIGEREQQLRRAQSELEQRIQERTSKLLEEISERKHADRKLQLSETQYRQLVETSSGLIWSVDTEGRWTFLNKMATHLVYAYEPEDLLGQNFLERSTPDYLEGDSHMLKTLISGRPIFTYETVHRRIDGSKVYLSFNAVALYNDRNEIIGATGTATDTTARNLSATREQELQTRLVRAERMESLGLLAGGVAHDLNNILGPVLGYPDLIEEELPEDSVARTDLREIKNSAKRAASVIQDLLTLSRRGGYQTEAVRLEDVVQDFLHSAVYRERVGLYPEIAVSTDFERALPLIEGSTPHLSQVIMNLVLNAFEAMETAGNLSIQLRHCYVDHPIRGYDSVQQGDYVVLGVADTGPGISEENLEKIFEPFYTKKKMGRSGTGLGLAVVYGVVKDLRGYIDIKTKVSEGTEFILYFPVSQKPLAEPVSETQHYSGTEKILVTDDVAEQRTLATRLLTSVGYNVSTANHGRQAVEYLKTHEVDLVIIDMVMEDDFDGLATYKAIREFKPDQPCIIASGFSENEAAKEALALGVLEYVKKPYTLDQISRAVREAIDHAPEQPSAPSS